MGIYSYATSNDNGTDIENAFYEACKYNKQITMDTLTKYVGNYKLNLNLQKFTSHSPLVWICKNGYENGVNIDIIKYCIEHGGNLDHKYDGESPYSPFYWLSKNSYIDGFDFNIIKYCVSQKCNLAAQQGDYYSPFMWLCKNSDNNGITFDDIMFCINQGCNLNETISEYTPFAWLCRNLDGKKNTFTLESLNRLVKLGAHITPKARYWINRWSNDCMHTDVDMQKHIEEIEEKLNHIECRVNKLQEACSCH